MCKACKARSAPSNVDVAKLKAEWLQMLYQGKPRPLGHLLTAAIPYINRLGAPFAPLVNWLQEAGGVLQRGCWRKAAGIDRRHGAPPLSAGCAFRRLVRPPQGRSGRRSPEALRPACCSWTIVSPPTTSRRSARRRCACWSGPARGLELANLRLLRGKPCRCFGEGFLNATRINWCRPRRRRWLAASPMGRRS